MAHPTLEIFADNQVNYLSTFPLDRTSYYSSIPSNSLHRLLVYCKPQARKIPAHSLGVLKNPLTTTMTRKSKNKSTVKANAKIAPKKTTAEDRWAIPQATRTAGGKKIQNMPFRCICQRTFGTLRGLQVHEGIEHPKTASLKGQPGTKGKESFSYANEEGSKTFSNLNDLNPHTDQVHRSASLSDQTIEPNTNQTNVANGDYETAVEQRAEFAYIVFYNGQSQEEQDRLMPEFKLLDLGEQAQWIAAYPGPLDDNQYDEIWSVTAWPTLANKENVEEMTTNGKGGTVMTNESGASEKFPCDADYCGIAFDSLADLNKHIAAAHPFANSTAQPPSTRRGYTCDVCGSVFVTEVDLTTHRIQGHSICPFAPCSERFATKEDVFSHLDIAHPLIVRMTRSLRREHATSATDRHVTGFSEINGQTSDVQRDQTRDTPGSALANHLELAAHKSGGLTTPMNPNGTLKMDDFVCEAHNCKEVFATEKERRAHMEVEHPSLERVTSANYEHSSGDNLASRPYQSPYSPPKIVTETKSTISANSRRKSVHFNTSMKGDNDFGGEEISENTEGDVVVVERTMVMHGKNTAEGANDLGIDVTTPVNGHTTIDKLMEGTKITEGAKAKESTMTTRGAKGRQGVNAAELIDNQDMLDFEIFKAIRGKKTGRGKGTSTNKKVKGGKRMAEDDAEGTPKDPKIVKVKKMPDGEVVKYLDIENAIIQPAPEDDFMNRMRRPGLEKTVSELKSKVAAMKRDGVHWVEIFEYERQLIKAENDLRDITAPTSCARGLTP
ncbi:hypothetical protein BDZ45DRAFT_742341 [Acephala macrosclerotiorum]|nr:hypothetical protein BDZ45DRAFT_742341 [Acephala macrosclerotiorum]